MNDIATPCLPPLDVLPAAPTPPRRTEAILDALPAVPALPRLPEPILEVLPAGPRPNFLVRAWRLLASVTEWLFGAAALLLGLSILASIPVVQLLSLGYLLEAGGRVARTGRLREGFVGVRQSARVGSIALGCVLMWLPLRLLASMGASAQVIDPDGFIARRWTVGLSILATLVGSHIFLACLRGGRLRYFFWPFNFVWLGRELWQGGLYARCRDGLWNFVMALRLPYYFWLGFRGFVGTLVWLVIPLALLGAGHRHPGLGILGALLFAFVVLYVPFLQMRFARSGRFRDLFAFRGVRADFRHAPVAFAFALFVTLLFALPLYALKIEMVPRETLFLESLVFLVFIFPARLLTGWAYGRATRRPNPRHWFLRWTSRFAMLPTVAFYVLIVFFSQHLNWGGVSSLYEQHAFLLPVPFLELRP